MHPAGLLVSVDKHSVLAVDKDGTAVVTAVFENVKLGKKRQKVALAADVDNKCNICGFPGHFGIQLGEIRYHCRGHIVDTVIPHILKNI